MSKTFAYAMFNEKGIKEYTSISDIYQKITDEAILGISQGRTSYEMAIKKAMKDMTSNGLRVVNYASGYSRRADSSIRLNIAEGIKRLNREVQATFGKEFGADGVEISHHKNAAPDHIDTVDGRQFSLNGNKTVNGVEYEDYNTINNNLERHVGDLNCQHYPIQIVLGVSEPLFSKEEIETDKRANMNGFEFEGNHYTNYEGTQLQRQIETKIRQYKDRQIGAKAINDVDEVYHCQEKIKQLTIEYNDLHKESGLPTKIDRLKVDGYRKIGGNTRSYYEKTLIGISNNGYTINGISEHLLDRKTSRNIRVEDVKDAFTNPLKTGTIKTDEQGRKSLQYIGEKSTIAFNPETGTIISVWKTSTKRVQKLKGDK